MRVEDNNDFKEIRDETKEEAKEGVKEEIKEEIKEDVLSEIKKPETPEKKSIAPKLPSIKKPKVKLNWWFVASIIFFVLFVAATLTHGFSGVTGMSAATAGETAIDFLNTYLLPPGTEASLIDVKQVSGVYGLTLNISGQEYESYITKDGNLFFISGIDLTQIQQKSGTNTETTPSSTSFDAPDSETPKVQLFVMSFCPYGQQAEKNIASVIELLSNSIEFEPHFIVNVLNDTVSSLHGSKEANEDMRQACIWKYYPENFWDYVLYVDENIPLNNIDEKWTEAADAAGIDADEIEKCVEDEGLDLLKAEDELSSELGVTGSPTLIINGEKYRGQRTPDAYKQAICSAFETQPDACSETLEDSGSSPTGNC